MSTQALEQQMQLFDNYGLWHVPFWHTRWFFYVVVTIGCLIVGLWIWWLLRKWSTKVFSPQQRALKQLQTLKKGPFDPEYGDIFYLRLTTLMKDFISDVYQKNVRSFTDQQMVVYVQELPILSKDKQGLEALFSAGELIKFAQQHAVAQGMNKDLDFCFRFVCQQHVTKKEDKQIGKRF